MENFQLIESSLQETTIAEMRLLNGGHAAGFYLIHDTRFSKYDPEKFNNGKQELIIVRVKKRL